LRAFAPLPEGVVLASGSTALGAAAAILGSILAALPLMIFNNWWVRVVGALFNRFRRGAPIAAGPAAAKA